MMRRRTVLRTTLHLGLALALVAVLTGGLFLLRSALTPPVLALLYLLPVGLSTTLWGLSAGIVASLSAFLAFNYFFIPPYYTLVVHQSQDFIALFILLFISVFISQLVGRTQDSLAETQAREREASHLYELSTALVGLRTEEAIARAVAERLLEVFRAQAVEVALDAGAPNAPRRISLPTSSAVPAANPVLSLPLATARGRLGEIRLWREAPFTSRVEAQLLQTFVSQCALALEYAMLSDVETQARILRESDRLKSALLSSVSHELRTPLATIKAAATSLRRGDVGWESPAREELLAVLEEEADHLNRLVGNLLDMSRIEAGALRPQRQWESLGEILGGTLTRMRHQTAAYHLSLDVSDDLPLIPVDAVQLDQVFTNLISNSLKYAPAGSRIGVRAWMVEPHMLQIQVCNQGPPVPAAQLDHIFDKFYRVTAADRVTGTGLGLSICRGIVEAHGGRIWAENLSEGFAFNFTLPLIWEGMPPPPTAPEAEAV